jgi:hypothetical protein
VSMLFARHCADCWDWPCTCSEATKQARLDADRQVRENFAKLSPQEKLDAFNGTFTVLIDQDAEREHAEMLRAAESMGRDSAATMDALLANLFVKGAPFPDIPTEAEEVEAQCERDKREMLRDIGAVP